jgi:hypothetical protein
MTRAKPRRNDDRIVTQTGARLLVEAVVEVDGDPARHLPVRARALSALDSGSLMRDRPANDRAAGLLGHSLARLRKDSP